MTSRVTAWSSSDCLTFTWAYRGTTLAELLEEGIAV
jgi:hypothetical protein